MLKSDLIKKLAHKTGETQKSVKIILNGFSEFIVETLIEDNSERIPLNELGNFKIKKVPEKAGVSNFGEKKTWIKPEHMKIVFQTSNGANNIQSR